MPKNEHNDAAEHHERAAKSHRTAAEHHDKGITTPGTNTLKKLMATLRRPMKDPHTRTERVVKRRVVSAKER